MKKLIISLIFSTFFLSLAILPTTALASGFLDMSNQQGFNGSSGNIPGAFGQETNKATDIRIIIVRIITISLGFLATIAVVLIIYAGFKWMTAAGNESNVEDAKKILTQATIGLVVILSAYGLTSFILSSIIKATGAK